MNGNPDDPVNPVSPIVVMTTAKRAVEGIRERKAIVSAFLVSRDRDFPSGLR